MCCDDVGEAVQVLVCVDISTFFYDAGCQVLHGIVLLSANKARRFRNAKLKSSSGNGSTQSSPTPTQVRHRQLKPEHQGLLPGSEVRRTDFISSFSIW
jgi:hypothetical protein